MAAVPLRRVDTWSDLWSTPESWAFDDRGEILVSCRKRHVAGIADHDVSPVGVVTPSLLCAEDDCGWHVMATLRDYA